MGCFGKDQMKPENRLSPRTFPAFCASALAGALLITFMNSPALADVPEGVRDVPIARGWAQNSVNAVIFRTHSVTTRGDVQVASFYDGDGRVTLARRSLGSTDWEIHDTGFQGNTRDAHNAICIGIDGENHVHLSWDHHGHPLKYRRSKAPGSFEFSDPLPMTGQNEERVTYPEFYNLGDGGFVFMYRLGASGSGRLMLNRYDPAAQEWRVIQHPLIDGEGKRNGYTNQLAIDSRGRWHLSWTWRSTGDVATNHHILYAMSPDEGESWFKSTGEKYTLPITYESAEIVAHIPQNSELINQCTMDVDSAGNPMIASYWRTADSEVPHYHLVWHDGSKWHLSQVSQRTTPFRLSGGGTRRIPISRPQLAVDREDRVYMIFRDEERGSRISVAITDDPERKSWRFLDLTEESVGMWEPTYDTELWKRDGVFHIFKQFVGQGQRETLEDVQPQMISILEWDPRYLKQP
jgi:hypothetical protein